MKSFNVKVGEPCDYSGYDRNNWTPRTSEHHRHFSLKYKEANTRKERGIIEHQTGVRYSILTELPYFDCVRLHVVDPMHNLLLGTSKRMMHVWLDSGLT